MSHNSKYNKSVMAFIALMFFNVISVASFAQKNGSGDFNLSESAINNLNAGIKSENTGLKKNAIYFAGLYLVNESSGTLVEQLKIEKDPSLRMCIIKSLYLISDTNYETIIRETANSDNDDNVRKFAQNLYSIMQLERSINIADINK